MRIGIVGAGIAGLATAAFLARDGHAVEVLERAERPSPMGAGLLLQPPGARVLAELGVLEGVAAVASRITRLEARTPGGRTLLDLDYGLLAPGLHGLGLARAAIWSAVLGAAERSGAVLMPGRSVAHVRDGEAPVARLENGEERTYDLLLVAAGTHTALRAAAQSRLYPWGCLWTTVALPPDWPGHVLGQRCVGTGVMLGVPPTGVAEGRCIGALYWSVRNDRMASWHRAPLADWHAAVARAWPEAEALVADLPREALNHATYRDVWADPPHGQRVLLIGDAAHGTSPQLGQGTTQALRDAVALRDALRAEGPVPDRLRAYWAMRRGRTAYYRRASRALTPVFQSALPGLGALRDVFAGPVGRIGFVRRQALLTLVGAKTGVWSADPVG
ncbi:FAD-dependent oxidoreductase [Roseomonas sp. CCTCC AB2023176]|uniref:FAD-dependent oxidoreductase n=1 Tax=Roseomonas sp. CCTCC AB2023176 TaxID=3342640 RepID=UPI0035D608CE